MTAVKAKPAVCVHHWLLGDPVGATVVGKCKRCEAVREFPAHIVQPEFARTNRKRAAKEIELL